MCIITTSNTEVIIKTVIIVSNAAFQCSIWKDNSNIFRGCWENSGYALQVIHCLFPVKNENVFIF